MSLTLEDAEILLFGKSDPANITTLSDRSMSSAYAGKANCGSLGKESTVIDSACAETSTFAPEGDTVVFGNSANNSLGLARNTRDSEPIHIPTTSTSFSSHQPLQDLSQAQSEQEDVNTLYGGSMSMTCATQLENSDVEKGGTDKSTVSSHTEASFLSSKMEISTDCISSFCERAHSPDTQLVMDKAMDTQPACSMSMTCITQLEKGDVEKEDNDKSVPSSRAEATISSSKTEVSTDCSSSFCEGAHSPDTQPVIDKAIIPQLAYESKPEEDRKLETSCSHLAYEVYPETSMKLHQEVQDCRKPEVHFIGTKRPRTIVPTSVVSKHLAVGTSTLRSANWQPHSHSPSVMTSAMKKKLFQQNSIPMQMVTTPSSHSLAVTFAAVHQEEVTNQTKETYSTGPMRTKDRLQNLPTPSNVPTTTIADKTASVLSDLQDECSLSYHDLSSPACNSAPVAGGDSSQQSSFLSTPLVATQTIGVPTLTTLASTIAGIGNKSSPPYAESSLPTIATPEINAIGGEVNCTILPNLTLLQPQELSHDEVDRTLLSPEPIARMLSAACTEDSWSLKVEPSHQKSTKSQRRRKSRLGNKQGAKKRNLSALEANLVDHLKQLHVRYLEIV